MIDRPSLPAGFVTTSEAAEQRGFSVRTARNRCLDHRIGIKVGGAWFVYAPALVALAHNDTGDLADAQRYVASIGNTDAY